MDPFAFRMQIFSTDNVKILVKLSGPVNETAEFIRGAFPPQLPVEIDLADMKSISSAGLRLFKDWLFSLPNKPMSLSFCPSFFVNQMNMIPNLIPSEAKILSFYVPYYSSSLGEEKMVLVTPGVEVRAENGNLSVNLPEVLDSTGTPMEIDIIEDKFFFFMRKQLGLD